VGSTARAVVDAFPADEAGDAAEEAAGWFAASADHLAHLAEACRQANPERGDELTRAADGLEKLLAIIGGASRPVDPGQLLLTAQDRAAMRRAESLLLLVLAEDGKRFAPADGEASQLAVFEEARWGLWAAEEYLTMCDRKTGQSVIGPRGRTMSEAADYLLDVSDEPVHAGDVMLMYGVGQDSEGVRDLRNPYLAAYSALRALVATGLARQVGRGAFQRRDLDDSVGDSDGAAADPDQPPAAQVVEQPGRQHLQAASGGESDD
jgi:hypothetical protein